MENVEQPSRRDPAFAHDAGTNRFLIGGGTVRGEGAFDVRQPPLEFGDFRAGTD